MIFLSNTTSTFSVYFHKLRCSYTEVSGCKSTFPEIDPLIQKLKGDMHELRADLLSAVRRSFLSIKMHCTINNVKFHVSYMVTSGCRPVRKMHSVTGKLFWDVMQRCLVVTDISGQPFSPIFMRQADSEEHCMSAQKSEDPIYILWQKFVIMQILDLLCWGYF